MRKLSFFLALLFCLLPIAACGDTNQTEPPNLPTAVAASFPDGYLGVGKPHTLKVTGADTDALTYRWYLDGEAIKDATTDTYTPSEADRCRVLSAEAYLGDTRIASSELLLNHIPVVKMNSARAITSENKYVETTVCIISNTPNGVRYEYDGSGEARVRGNSTAGFPKRPYKLKLDSSANLFGMGKSRHWVLVANYIDESNMHNSLALSLSSTAALSVEYAINTQPSLASARTSYCPSSVETYNRYASCAVFASSD